MKPTFAVRVLRPMWLDKHQQFNPCDVLEFEHPEEAGRATLSGRAELVDKTQHKKVAAAMWESVKPKFAPPTLVAGPSFVKRT